MRFILALSSILVVGVSAMAQPAEWQTWSMAQAESVGKSTYVKGQVGSRGTIRLLKTERAINYKLAATWLTPDVIFACARALQLRGRLSDEETLALADEAQESGDTIVIVDIDPNEGSGVVPLEWEVFLQPKGRPDRAVAGIKTAKLREVRALQGVIRRNYDYDRFWVAFPTSSKQGQPLFQETDREAELVVRIYEREGTVTWEIPASVRERRRKRAGY